MDKGLATSKNNHSRILLIDALRGFALFGIILLHHIEHFNLFIRPLHSPAWLEPYDQIVFDSLHFLFAGKAYALFSLLFGLSFHLQFERDNLPHYKVQFLKRMIFLFGFGLIHIAFYGGDILVFYALLSLLLLLSHKLTNKWLLAVAVILLASPVGLYHLLNPSLILEGYSFYLSYPPGIDSLRISNSFIELAIGNFKYGVAEHFVWAWNNGRLLNIPGLFLLGLYLGRIKLLTAPSSWWIKALLLGLACLTAIEVFLIKASNFQFESDQIESLEILLAGYSKISFMWVLLAGFVLCWRMNNLRQLFVKLTPLGKMGLSNYILSSIIGTFLYYGWGLGLYRYCGSTMTLFIAITMFVLQMKISSLWLRHRSQGPLEYLWRMLTQPAESPRQLKPISNNTKIS